MYIRFDNGWSRLIVPGYEIRTRTGEWASLESLQVGDDVVWEVLSSGNRRMARVVGFENGEADSRVVPVNLGGTKIRSAWERLLEDPAY